MFKIKNEKPKDTLVFLEEQCGKIRLKVEVPDGHTWYVAGITEKGELELYEGIPVSTGLSTDKSGCIVFTKAF